MPNFLSFLKKHFLLSSTVLTILLACLWIFSTPVNFFNSVENASLWVRDYFGGFYLYLGFGCVVFLLIFALLPIGKKRLGGKTPEYSFFSWMAMLYSAGMGSGILLRATQEPVFMQQNPPIDTGVSSEILSLEYVFYHWGLTAWAFYVFFALIMGYSFFIKKEKLAISTVFSAKSNSISLQLIDFLAIITTVVGLVASLGMGAKQVEDGANFLMGSNENLIDYSATALIFLGAGYSAYRGIHKGIQRISNINIILTLALLFFVFVQSDVLLIFDRFFSALYHYIIDFIPMSLALGKYDPGKEFLTDWTYYYWAFWLAWAPFTGVFIARISRGRSMRQMILGALIVPSLSSFFWFSVFGSEAFSFIEEWGSYSGEFSNVFSSIFVFLTEYPLGSVTVVITLILLLGFLITSADSAIFVLSMFTDRGKEEPKKSYRLIWTVILFLFTIAVLLVGSSNKGENVLTAMQKLLIVTSLPFSFFTVLIAIKLVLKLKKKA
jgi:glycine betaine transporter